jgi:predicted RNase H-like HicB family nuclease
MITLKYSLVIEATKDPCFFGFYSPELEGFTGVGHSIEDCVYKARHGMEEHVKFLREHKLPVPPVPARPLIVIQNEQAPENRQRSARRRSANRHPAHARPGTRRHAM